MPMVANRLATEALGMHAATRRANEAVERLNNTKTKMNLRKAM